MSQDTPPDSESMNQPGTSPNQAAFSPDDALPPVEAPGAGFLLQLFIVPAVIVLVIVMVWLMFQWIARGDDDPRQLIQKIALPTATRFQAAHRLADVLHDKRYEEFKRDPKAAEELAKILEKELDKKSDDESTIDLEIFLCRALGEFEVDKGLDVLLRAAQTQNSKADILVRQHAIAAIAVRAEHAANETPSRKIEHPGLTEAMLKMADDQEYIVRGATAVSLSWLGQEELLDKLRQMLDDPYPDVRFNAAINCARLGDEKSIDVLLEMLDPENAGVAAEKGGGSEKANKRNQSGKRVKILLNALRALELLENANPEMDLSVFIPAVESLSKSEIDRQIKVRAKEALYRLKDKSQ